jgi:hypothetical protein
MSVRPWCFAIAVFLCSLMAGQNAAMAADRLVLAELFTSQSCSSCPPADALLGDLAKRRDVLALSFHVDYWDGLGWKDPFSSHAATARQERYADLLGAQVYTPQLVVDGRAEAVGSDRRAVEGLLRREQAALAAATIRQNNGHLQIHVDGATSPGANRSADILLVTFDPIHKTSVRGGENGGRYLVTYNDVRSFRTVGTWRGEAVSLDVAANAGEVGERAAIIVQSSDGAVWALATTEAAALD